MHNVGMQGLHINFNGGLRMMNELLNIPWYFTFFLGSKFHGDDIRSSVGFTHGQGSYMLSCH